MSSDRDRWRTVGFLAGGRSRPRVREGREHPDSGQRWKATRDEAGNTVTEHGAPGSGVSFRQDVTIAAPHVTREGSTRDG